MDTFANSEDLDEMNVAFHQGMHYLLRQNQYSETEVYFNFEILTCDPYMYNEPYKVHCIRYDRRIQ